MRLGVPRTGSNSAFASPTGQRSPAHGLPSGRNPPFLKLFSRACLRRSFGRQFPAFLIHLSPLRVPHSAFGCFLALSIPPFWVYEFWPFVVAAHRPPPRLGFRNSHSAIGGLPNLQSAICNVQSAIGRFGARAQHPQ